jgi:hypothetical protein
VTDRSRTRGEARFASLSEHLVQEAGVTRSKMMGFPCLRLDGAFFASCDHRTGDLVVKLNEQRVSELLDAHRGEPFAPNGRRFREWVAIPARDQRRWPKLLDEALRLAAKRRSPDPDELDQVRTLALAFPEVNERSSHGAPCFFVRDQRALCYFHDDHRGDGRVSLWCPAPPGVQEELVATEPGRFFRPPTSASGAFSGWVGVYLDSSGAKGVDWNEIAAILDDAYRLAAPKRLVAELLPRTGGTEHRRSPPSPR